MGSSSPIRADWRLVLLPRASAGVRITQALTLAKDEVERGHYRNFASERRGGVPQELNQRRVGPFGGFDEKRRVVDLEVSITITRS
jgi:hypothetical protein